MKKALLFAAALCLLAACGNNARKNAAKTADTAAAQQTAAPAPAKIYQIDDLLTDAEDLVGKQVTVRGHVTHTCKHSGKRCFIVGDDQKTSLRVEAKGNIGGFNRELIGSQLDITGILRENRLSREYLDRMEKDLNEKRIEEDGSAETCEAELANIDGMKAWMETHGKDYYSVYYLDGEDYEVVE